MFTSHTFVCPLLFSETKESPLLSPLMCDDNPLGSTEFVMGVILAGLNKSNSDLLRCIWQVDMEKALSSTRWERETKIITQKLRELVKSSCDDALRKEYERSNNSLVVMSDCCWNIRGFNSPLGAVSLERLKEKALPGMRANPRTGIRNIYFPS